jgi:polar amino acid transport system substrate-binding protein
VGIEMAKALGVKPVFVDTIWPSIIPALNLGRFDIIFGGMSVTEARKEKVDFANPFMTVGQTVLLNAKHEETVQSYKDLNDPKFVVVSKPGTTGEEAVQRLIPKATYETADTEIEGAMRVLEGTADAFVYDFPFNAVFRALHPSNQLVFLDEPFTEEPIAWAIRKNDPDFMKFLNDFLGPDQSRWSLRSDLFQVVSQLGLASICAIGWRGGCGALRSCRRLCHDLQGRQS